MPGLQLSELPSPHFFPLPCLAAHLKERRTGAPATGAGKGVTRYPHPSVALSRKALGLLSRGVRDTRQHLN